MVDNSLQRSAPFGQILLNQDGPPDDLAFEEDPDPEGLAPEPPPEIAFRTPFPRPRLGALRNIAATVLVGIAIVGIVWYFDSPSSAASSQNITLTATASGPAPRVGQVAPDFTVQDVNGNLHKLSDYRGSPVWINFWASWCPPCRAENPDIQAVYDANSAAGLVVLGIAIGEDTGTVKDYAGRAGLTYTIGLDGGTDIAATYRIVGIPTHFFIDRDGILRDWRIGSLSKDTMDAKVAEIMGNSGAGGGP
jgi:cytochrome c biogenesis protein CcmG, thiol:disulfide interchange protein DsbE